MYKYLNKNIPLIIKNVCLTIIFIPLIVENVRLSCVK